MTILYVGTDPDRRIKIRRALKEMGIVVETAVTQRAALDCVTDGTFAFAIYEHTLVDYGDGAGWAKDLSSAENVPAVALPQDWNLDSIVSLVKSAVKAKSAIS